MARTLLLVAALVSATRAFAQEYQPNPLPIQGMLGQVELVREVATLVMLLTLGLLAGRTWRARWGYSALAFGIDARVIAGRIGRDGD